MSEYSIIICTNRRYGVNSASCAERGSLELADELERLLDEAGLAIPVLRIRCLGHCEQGPNLRIAPGGRFFHGVKRGDLAEVITEIKRIFNE